MYRGDFAGNRFATSLDQRLQHTRHAAGGHGWVNVVDDGFEEPAKLRLGRRQMLSRLLIRVGDPPTGAFVQRGQLSGEEQKLVLGLLASLRGEAGGQGADQLFGLELREIGPVRPIRPDRRQGQLDAETNLTVQVDHHCFDELSSPSVFRFKRLQANDQVMQGGVVLGDRRLQHGRPGLRILGRRRLARGPVSVRRAIARSQGIRFGQKSWIKDIGRGGLRTFRQAGCVQLIAGVAVEKGEVRSSHG